MATIEGVQVGLSTKAQTETESFEGFYQREYLRVVALAICDFRGSILRRGHSPGRLHRSSSPLEPHRRRNPESLRGGGELAREAFASASTTLLPP